MIGRERRTPEDYIRNAPADRSLSLEMALLAYEVRFRQPRPEFIVDVVRSVQPERVHVVAWRDRLNGSKAGTLVTTREHDMAIEPPPRELETILVANQRVQLPFGNAHVSAVRVDGGPDVADMYIAERATAGDVAVTADIPLAALLVPKGVVVIDPRGAEYTAESIGERLSVRNFLEGLRASGVDTGGQGTFGVREKQAFANALDRALTRAMREPGLEQAGSQRPAAV